MATQRTYGCPVEVAIDALGGRWKPVILWYLVEAPRRNGELRRLIPGVSQKMLTQQLRELEHDGLVTRVVHQEVPPKVVYSLSREGRKIKPLLEALCDWGTYWARRTGAQVTNADTPSNAVPDGRAPNRAVRDLA